MSPEFLVLARVVLVLAGTILLVSLAVFLLGRRDRGARAPLRVAGVAAPVLGVLLIASVLAAEAWRIASRDVEPDGDTVVHLVADPPPNADSAPPAPDRLQVLVVVSDATGLMRPRELHERILELPADPAESFGFFLAAVDSTFQFEWPTRADLRKLLIESSTSTIDSHHLTRTFGPSRPDRIDLGDGRGFSIWISGHVAARGFGLRDPDRVGFQLLFRGLAPGDRLATRPAGEAFARIAATVRTEVLLASFPAHVDPYRADPVRRVASEWSGWGFLVLLNGILLVLAGRVSKLRGAAAATVFIVVLTSVASRLDVAYAETLIRDPDPDVRAAAAVRLAAQKAFAPRASEALRHAFEREQRTDLRAAYLLAAVSDGNPMIYLPAVGRMIERAEEDPSEAIRNVARLLREHSKRIASPPR